MGIMYQGIYIGDNCYKYTDNCSKLMIFTPDVERYADTIEDAKHIVDVFTHKNGRIEFYNKRQDNKIFKLKKD